MFFGLFLIKMSFLGKKNFIYKTEQYETGSGIISLNSPFIKKLQKGQRALYSHLQQTPLRPDL